MSPSSHPAPTALGLVALALLAAPPAGAQVAERLADLRLETAVRLALVADARTRPLDVAVAARGGVVWIEGSGDAPAVADVAGGVPGVRSLGGADLGDVPAAPPVVVEPRPAPSATETRDAPAAEGGAAFHTTRRGDTLFSLARRYGTTVEAILALNGRGAPSIRVGERLRVR